MPVILIPDDQTFKYKSVDLLQLRLDQHENHFLNSWLLQYLTVRDIKIEEIEPEQNSERFKLFVQSSRPGMAGESLRRVG